MTFENCQCQRHVTLIDEAAASGQPVTFDGGSVLLPNSGASGGGAGIIVDGPGRLTFDRVVLARLPALRPPTDPAWSVTDHGFLALDDSTVVAPLGTHDQSSTVLITG